MREKRDRLVEIGQLLQVGITVALRVVDSNYRDYYCALIYLFPAHLYSLPFSFSLSLSHTSCSLSRVFSLVRSNVNYATVIINTTWSGAHRFHSPLRSPQSLSCFSDVRRGLIIDTIVWIVLSSVRRERERERALLRSLRSLAHSDVPRRKSPDTPIISPLLCR